MSKTKIPGSRIKALAITEDHLSDTLQIPESKLNLINATHPHTNKGAIDVVRYTGSSETVDLKQLELLLAEIVAARRDGLNLGNTIDLKTDQTDFDTLLAEIVSARGDSEDLTAAIQAYGDIINERLNNHIGATGHDELDTLYADFTAAKNGRASLLEYLEEIAAEGTTNPDGDLIIDMIQPWTYEYTIQIEGERAITIPYTYVVGTNSIEVFDGPLRMIVGSTADYLETSESEITFNYDLPVGTLIRFRGVVKTTLYEWQQTFLSETGQRQFTLMSSYEQGQNQIMVFEDGLLLQVDVDYVESSDTMITMLIDLPADTRIVVTKRR